MTSFDAIVIGGGHNGLVAATTLAKAGRKVLVLEAGAEIGGAARTEEFAPGFRVSSVAHLLNRLHPDVITTLELEKHRLRILRADFMPSVALSRDGPPLVLHGAYGDVVTGASSSEQSAWKELRAQLLRYAGILKPFLSRRPPDLAGMSLLETAALGQAALALKKLGKEDMRDFLRVLLMNVADLLDEQLTDIRLKGLLAFDATLGSHLGPRSPTSLLGLYYRLAGETGGVAGAQMLPQGGMGAVVNAIRASAEKSGVTIRTSVPVAKIIVENGRAVGVALANGEELRARTIVSAINPATTFLDLVGPRQIDTGFVRKVKNIRMKGDAAKLNLALDRPPQFAGVDAAGHKGRLVIAPSPDHVERAFNPSKYGAFSPEPVMEITLPSLADPSLAPDGACVLSAVVQYAPYALKEGWAAGKPNFLEAIITQLDTYAPGIGKSVVHAELLTPADIEARYRMPGGHWHHGELQADQMLISRPVSGWSGYDTPLDGLFLAGAGSHPGGGVSGASGLNAARRIIAMRG
ncbi:NAD(P)/FAD-dependent oxidoreductase [Mesorhizobium opportunistum]|uniref:Pyridine nucleotide-disulfide oxidoreductase domain-containing protein 2 n=1 Tax=Mesorhizobium opportunistum TaxID=593909 RepID=A0ABV1YCI7_9HYPH|nr:NAD(P)/FAD-dependent oxidoreductase [Mesorhizobium sp.]TIN94992.1 MAG: NAD(P)/FAD-dependent oxidoreductase [Mesorhizobium sp.]TJU96971.1 MAG: NAD(P)/FAD-dependent oxidoreductase [Mesorhizobium sp.]TJV18112.1 MAG: NAD(P)/FAD-dependent oxidoreductase [Mesorhizobium sp.]